jgi:protein-S-isoprenylcysteine O-methyltransferase Ste14
MDLEKAVRDRWVWGQFLLFLIVLFGAPLIPRYINLGAADFLLNRVDPPWIRWLSVALFLIGVLLAVWGMRSLGPNLTPGTEPLADAELVTTGAYAHVRHPIYAGVVLLLSGYTLAWSNWTLALLVGFVALKYFEAKARVEERWLVQRFPLYSAYTRQVPRRVL